MTRCECKVTLNLYHMSSGYSPQQLCNMQLAAKYIGQLLTAKENGEQPSLTDQLIMSKFRDFSRRHFASLNYTLNGSMIKLILI